MRYYADTVGDRGSKGKGSWRRLVTRFFAGHKNRDEIAKVTLEHIGGNLHTIDIECAGHRITETLERN